MKKLPIGVQSIEKILSENEYMYVDKTGLIKRLIDEGTPHYFMSRPRRFGKSLFVNTLEEISREIRTFLKVLRSTTANMTGKNILYYILILLVLKTELISSLKIL